MDFLANENFPLASIRKLRDDNHNVKSVIEETAGAEDYEVLNLARQEDRIILIFPR